MRWRLNGRVCEQLQLRVGRAVVVRVCVDMTRSADRLCRRRLRERRRPRLLLLLVLRRKTAESSISTNESEEELSFDDSDPEMEPL